MTKQRLDQALVEQKLVSTRSQAESYIKLGQVTVNGRPETKPGTLVRVMDKLVVNAQEQYVSRAALKLASVAQALRLEFSGKVVLDVGSSTGGFTEYALKHGARKVIAVEAGSNQLHPSLRENEQIELHEQTDIRALDELSAMPDLVLADVSFVSLREILPHVATLIGSHSQLAVMVKPQFEAANSSLKHKGVIKNDAMRRQILKDFESWAGVRFRVINKADSAISGAKGNQERFYLLQKALA